MAFLRATHLVDEAVDRDLQAHSGLTHGDYEILARLAATPDQRLRMSDLAEQVLVSRSRLTYQVKRMEHAGLLRRESCPSDARGALAVLTLRGHEALREAAPGHVACVRRVLIDVLTPEQIDVVGEALETVIARLTREGEGRGRRCRAAAGLGALK